MFSGKDLRVMELVKFLDDPVLFKYIEKYFNDRIFYEENQINQTLRKLITTDIQKDSLNLHILRKQIFQEIKWGLKESLIEYTKLDDSDFTETGGAEYQKVSGDFNGPKSE